MFENRIYLVVEYKGYNGKTEQMFAPFELKLSKPLADQIKVKGKQHYLDHLKKKGEWQKDEIIKECLADEETSPSKFFTNLKEEGSIIDAYPTFIDKKGKFVNGEYFAHEYGEYVKGKGRAVKYLNGHVEYEIKCLDKSKRVADGMWDEQTNNGMGDEFHANKELTI